ncbi:MAG: UDP-2,3-diacylglucosamine diphosphatase [Arenicella sp.]
MSTAFISDLHLSAKAPDISQRFQQYLLNELSGVDTLYILGDLFEYWIGDDAASMLGMEPVLDALKILTDNGIKGYFLAGNRDFLVGDVFAKHTGFTILEDESIIELNGEKVLILHGDSLCTDDHLHQQFRQQMMCNKAFHQHALSLSIEERIATAEKMRGMSAEHKSEISDEIMDVNADAVVQLFEKHQVTRMIHGHTHRPAIHKHATNTGNAERIVLGDWYTQSSFLLHNENGFTLSNLA